MKATQIYLLLHFIVTANVLVDAFNPFGLIADLWRNSYESCDSKWISFNAEGEDARHVNVKTVVLCLYSLF